MVTFWKTHHWYYISFNCMCFSAWKWKYLCLHLVSCYTSFPQLANRLEIFFIAFSWFWGQPIDYYRIDYTRLHWEMFGWTVSHNSTQYSPACIWKLTAKACYYNQWSTILLPINIQYCCTTFKSGGSVHNQQGALHCVMVFTSHM